MYELWVIGLGIFALNGMVMLGMYNKMIEFNRRAVQIEKAIHKLRIRRRGH